MDKRHRRIDTIVELLFAITVPLYCRYHWTSYCRDCLSIYHVAASWFPDNQRGLATTIGVMSNPLGVLLANVISPQMVKAPQHVLYLNIFTFVPSAVAMILATFFVRRSEPKIPPTYSASKPQMDFIPGNERIALLPFDAGLKSCMTSKQYLILFFVMGGGIGMFNCLYTIMQELLCPSGYSNSFVGICAALMIIGGIVGAAGSGIFVDRTKMYEETMKVAMGLAVVFGLIFMQVKICHQLMLCLFYNMKSFFIPSL
ncbi:unnamed protein product [Cylicostephanus goldi]|uniref:Major facilitator superfamily (MFS) profile domain-containing protein n=1 Tax=Cylicostephanus goldi TaxID=71465 RepID=A0A3P6SC85_CYLGO|nr:unnamed protein product [Cylicostephanus goldi]